MSHWLYLFGFSPLCVFKCVLKLLALGQTIWGHIWKRTAEKSQTNATNATMHALIQVFWGDIWKYTVEKSQTDATNVILHNLIDSLWRHIWKHTAEKSQTNATNVNLHPFMQVLWAHIWNHTQEKRQTNTISPLHKSDEHNFCHWLHCNWWPTIFSARSIHTW